MLLCPNNLCTCSMSFVLWYSFVPNQCRNVMKVMSNRRGFLSLQAAVLRLYRKAFLSFWCSKILPGSVVIASILFMRFCDSVSMRVVGALLLGGSELWFLPLCLCPCLLWLLTRLGLLQFLLSLEGKFQVFGMEGVISEVYDSYVVVL